MPIPALLPRASVSVCLVGLARDVISHVLRVLTAIVVTTPVIAWLAMSVTLSEGDAIVHQVRMIEVFTLQEIVVCKRG